MPLAISHPSKKQERISIKKGVNFDSFFDFKLLLRTAL